MVDYQGALVMIHKSIGVTKVSSDMRMISLIMDSLKEKMPHASHNAMLLIGHFGQVVVWIVGDKTYINCTEDYKDDI